MDTEADPEALQNGITTTAPIEGDMREGTSHKGIEEDTGGDMIAVIIKGMDMDTEDMDVDMDSMGDMEEEDMLISNRIINIIRSNHTIHSRGMVVVDIAIITNNKDIRNSHSNHIIHRSNRIKDPGELNI